MTGISNPPQTVLGYRKDGRPIRVIAGGDDTATPSPVPTAGVSPSPQPTSATINGHQFVAPASSGGSSSDSLYGTGAWGSKKINIGAFPPVVAQALANTDVMKAVIKAGGDGSQMTGAQLAQALASIKDKGAVAQIQQLLFYSGFYTNGTTLADLQLGTFGDKDTAALANSVVTAGRTDQPLGTYLQTSMQIGVAQGVINRSSGVGITPINTPAPVDEDYALRNAAHTLLGREPSATDLAGFRAYFDQAYQAGQKQAQKDAAAQTAANMPDATTLGGAMARMGVANPETGLLMGAPAELGKVGGQFTSANAAQREDTINTTDFNTQQTQDKNTLAQFNTANEAAGQVPTITMAPNVNDAASAYLQSHDSGAVQTQNALGAYAQILAFIKGDGSIQ